jgi:excisionase family DNA binding protein
MKTDRLLTLREAEQMTGRKVSTWRKDVKERRVPYVKLGRQIRVPLEVVEKMISEGFRDAVPRA